MQPSELQVQRSIAALRRSTDEEVDGDGTPKPWVELPPEVVDLLRRIDGTPGMRQDRIEAVRARIADGDAPTADDIADKLVGRLVCDRLR